MIGEQETRKVYFHVSFDGSSSLTLDDIWPDGDAPENPTVEDVVAEIAKCGFVDRFLSEWNMTDLLRVWVDAGSSAKAMEVKFR